MSRGYWHVPRAWKLRRVDKDVLHHPFLELEFDAFPLVIRRIFECVVLWNGAVCRHEPRACRGALPAESAEEDAKFRARLQGILARRNCGLDPEIADMRAQPANLVYGVHYGGAHRQVAGLIRLGGKVFWLLGLGLFWFGWLRGFGGR